MRTTTFIALILLSGCYDYHRVDRARDSGTDARDTFVDTREPDASTPDTSVPDTFSPRPDAMPICDLALVPESLNSFCVLTPTGELPSGERFRFPIRANGCYCLDTLLCEVELRDRELRLSVNRCPSSADCDGCTPFIETQCDIPSLPRGPIDVVVNDEPIYRLNATPRERRDPAEPRCIDVRPSCELPTLFGPSLGTLCHPATSDVGTQLNLRVDGCPDCAATGCDVQLSGRNVMLTTIYSSCDIDCKLCGAPLRCLTPALRSGSYNVFVDGAPVSSFRIEDVVRPDATEICVEL